MSVVSGAGATGAGGGAVVAGATAASFAAVAVGAVVAIGGLAGFFFGGPEHAPEHAPVVAANSSSQKAGLNRSVGTGSIADPNNARPGRQIP